MQMEMLPKRGRGTVYDFIFLCCKHCTSVYVEVKQNNFVFISLSVYFLIFPFQHISMIRLMLINLLLLTPMSLKLLYSPGLRYIILPL